LQSGSEHVGVMRRGHEMVIRSTRTIMIALGLITAVLLAVAFGIDEGEIVTLVSLDPNGMQHDTQLWFVQIGDVQYLRASNSKAEWLDRVERHPRITLERDEVREVYDATPSRDDPAVRDLVNTAMTEKYGFADRIWALVSDRSNSVPIRLDPAPPGALPLQPDAPNEGVSP